MIAQLRLKAMLELAERALDGENEFHREEAETLAEHVVALGKYIAEHELLRDPDDPPHPMQPLVFDALGTVRFKRNRLVRFMFEYMTEHRFGLNLLRSVPGIEQGDLEQFYQLIGTSVSSYGDTFPDSPIIAIADATSERMVTMRPPPA